MLAVRRDTSRRLLAAVVTAAVLLVLVLLDPVVTVWPAGGSERPPVKVTGTQEPALTGLTATAALRQLCLELREGRGGLVPDVRQLQGVCQRLGSAAPPSSEPTGCHKAVMYTPIGRLGNLMSLYGIIYGFGRLYGSTGYVGAKMWSTLHKYFPDISLRPAPPDIKWEGITYQQAPAKLECRPDDSAEPRFFRIADWPANNGIDVFHRFKDEIRKEFTFSKALQNEAQEFLRHARGGRSSATYVGFHVRRTDFVAYARNKYNHTLPGFKYFDRVLGYYRRRFSDALFIVCSDDIGYVTTQLKAAQNDDIVIAGNRNIRDPGRDMALLSACNHSAITVGTFGFWSGYLAGGTVIAPDPHMTRPAGGKPLLPAQRVDATNFVRLAGGSVG